jgi:hypothetical protein
MKIGICTNLPVEFNPMPDSYINYLGENASVINVSCIRNNKLWNEPKVRKFVTNLVR